MVQMFVTKYALTGGIESRELEPSSNDSIYFYDRSAGWGQFVLNRNCFVAQADAVSAAAKMRDKKVASLRKQITRLNNLDFSP